MCICKGVFHTSRESSRFQIVLIPSLASTVILNVVALTDTPNPMKGRDTLQQTKSAKMRKQQLTKDVIFQRKLLHGACMHSDRFKISVQINIFSTVLML